MSGIYFDKSVVSLAQQFAGQLMLTKCTPSGKPEPLELLPHSLKLVANLLGWKRDDGRRLYRKCYASMARKNAKTQTIAFLALFQFFFDREPEQEILMAATSREQASLCFDAALSMLQTNPDLTHLCKVTRSSKLIRHRETGSVIKALSAEGRDKHGSNPSTVILDELHMWGSAEQELYDALTTGSIARRQSLQVFITTAGTDQQSLCHAEYEYAKRVISRQIEDQTYLPLIWETPADADWTDERTWHLANPTIGRIVQLDELRTEFHKALNNPREQNKFRRLHLNQWTNSETAWIPLTQWDACGTDKLSLRDLEGKPCYGGLDLGATTDLTAFVLAWPLDDSKIFFHPWFFIPREGLQERCRRDRVPYDRWAKDGHVQITPSAATDWKWTTDYILQLRDRFDIRSVAFDRWGADDVQQRLTDASIKVEQLGQGYGSMSAPSKRLEAMVYERTLVHGGHPILRWNMDCCTVDSDPAGNIKPVKPSQLAYGRRIDGVVASVMALHEAMKVRRVQPFVF